MRNKATIEKGTVKNGYLTLGTLWGENLKLSPKNMSQSTDFDLNLHYQCGQEKPQAENLLYSGFKLVDQVTGQGNSNPSGKKSMSRQVNNYSKCHEL